MALIVYLNPCSVQHYTENNKTKKKKKKRKLEKRMDTIGDVVHRTVTNDDSRAVVFGSGRIQSTHLVTAIQVHKIYTRISDCISIYK